MQHTNVNVRIRHATNRKYILKKDTLRVIFEIKLGIGKLHRFWVVCCPVKNEKHIREKTHFGGDSESIISNSYICTVYVACHGYGTNNFFNITW